MPACPKIAKERMKAEGIWEDFCKARHVMQPQGVEVDPHTFTAEVFEGLKSTVDVNWDHVDWKSKTPVPGSGKTPKPRAKKAAAKKKAKEPKTAATEGKGWIGEVPDAQTLLDSQRRAVAIAWVAEVMEADEVTAEMAPSGEAWSLYCAFSATVSTKTEFFTKMYTKLTPTKIEHHGRGLANDKAFDSVDFDELLAEAEDDLESEGTDLRPGAEDEEG